VLVYAKNPRGILHLGRFRIYGKETGRKPVDIPFDLYNAYKSTLQDGTYREDTLSRLFDKPFPAVAFTYNELRWIPDSTLDTIGTLIVEEYDLEWSHKKKVDQIKRMIASVSPTS
jgi:hypothetical protein